MEIQYAIVIPTSAIADAISISTMPHTIVMVKYEYSLSFDLKKSDSEMQLNKSTMK